MSTDQILAAVTDLAAQVKGIAGKVGGVEGTSAAVSAELATLKAKMDSIQELQYKAQVEQANRPLGDNEKAIEVYHARYASDSEIKGHADAWGKGGEIRLWGYEVDGVQRFGYLDDPNPRTDHQREAQRVLTTRNIAHMALSRSDRPGERRATHSEAVLRAVLASGPSGISKIFANSTGIGTEYIPTNLAPEVERRIEYVPGVASMFETDVINSTTAYRAYVAGNIRPYIEQIPTADNPANAQSYVPGSAQNTLTVKPFAASGQFHLDAVEDAIVNEVSEFTDQLVRGFALGRDDVWINGDTTATHEDAIASWNPRSIYSSTTGAGSTIDHRRAWKGLRRLAVDKSTTADQSAVQTMAGAITLACSLDPKFYANIGPEQPVIYLASPEYAFKTLITFVQTYDQGGLVASMLTGLLPMAGGPAPKMLPGYIGNISGRAVCVTWALTADLAASGLYTGSGSKTGMLALYRPSFRNVVRKGVTIGAQDSIGNNTRLVVARARFGGRETQGTTDKTVAYSYNLTS